MQFHGGKYPIFSWRSSANEIIFNLNSKKRFRDNGVIRMEDFLKTDFRAFLRHNRKCLFYVFRITFIVNFSHFFAHSLLTFLLFLVNVDSEKRSRDENESTIPYA